MKRIGVILLLPVLFAGCFGAGASKPEAIGSAGKINIVLAPGLQSGEVGRLLDSIFTREATVFPRDEQMFNIQFVNPSAVNRSQRSMRNLIFVFTFDDQSTEGVRARNVIEAASLNRLRSDKDGYVVTQSDVFARGQEIMYLYSNDAKTLAQRIKANGDRLTQFFNEKERKRLETGLMKATNTKLSKSLGTKYGFQIQIPAGYQVADQQKDFLWLRQINPADDKDIWIGRRPYTGTDDFKQENLIALRNSFCKKYLFEDPEKPDTYLVTETTVSYKPVVTRTINYHGLFATEIKGLWKTNIPSMGGPFIGFAMVDEASGMLYYIEGFTYSPAKSQREIMRELEVIMRTFRPGVQGAQSATTKQVSGKAE